MVELIDAFNEQGELVKTAEKGLILSEVKEYSIANGDAHLAVPAVLLLLVHPSEGIYVVKRAAKSENPHLWCKTVGGHIHHGEDPDDALIRESAEETSTEIVIAQSLEEYQERLVYTDLRDKAVVRQIDFQPWFRTDRIDRETGRPWRRRFRAHIYAGKLHKEHLQFTKKSDEGDFSDGLGEAVEHAFYQKDVLKRMLDDGDRRFTHDLAVLVRNYYTFL